MALGQCRRCRCLVRDPPRGDLRALARYHDRFVDPAALDITCLRPLRAAQTAINDVVRSEVYRAGMLTHAAHAADLRQHEWEIACRLREITKLDAEYAAVCRPVSLARRLPRSCMRIAAPSTSRGRRRLPGPELERYAAVVKAADAALRDWKTAQQVADRNDLYLDLVAGSEADQQAVAEESLLSLIRRSALGMSRVDPEPGDARHPAAGAAGDRALRAGAVRVTAGVSSGLPAMVRWVCGATAVSLGGYLFGCP